MHWHNIRWCYIILFTAISVVKCQYCSFASSASFTPNHNVGTDRYIYRPCENLDVACISEFFFRHSNGYCRKPTGQPTNIFHVHDNFSVFFPKYNVTMRDHEDRSYRFDKAEITEFFVNYHKDFALLSVKFWGFTTDGGTSYIHYKRRQEPKALHTTTKNVFDYIETTTYLKGIHSLSLSSSETHAYVSASKSLDLGRGFRENKDPEWTSWLNLMVYDLDTSLQEITLHRGPPLAAYYVQNNLCDYGQPLSVGGFQPII